MLNGKLIQKRRIEMKMSQQELAEKLGFGYKSSVCRLEKGELDLKTSKAVRLSKVLQIEIQDLIKGGYKNV